MIAGLYYISKKLTKSIRHLEGTELKTRVLDDPLANRKQLAELPDAKGRKMSQDLLRKITHREQRLL